jgi:hypothetical protein
MHKALKILAGLAAAYLLFCAAILAIMRQPPGRFARAIAKAPSTKPPASSFARSGAANPWC